MNIERAKVMGPTKYWRIRVTVLFLAALIAALLLTLPIPAAAQRTTGTLRGQVLDPTSAGVPNARVTAANQDTGVSISIETTSAGTYDFPSVLPGKYTVTVEAAGFTRFVKLGGPVLADLDNVADAKLELGTAPATVEGVAGAWQVKTTDPPLNNSFDAKDAAALPHASGP